MGDDVTPPSEVDRTQAEEDGLPGSAEGAGPGGVWPPPPYSWWCWGA